MRCLVVDDHPLTRDGTALALRRADSSVDVLEAASLAQACATLDSVSGIELVLLDLDLDDSSGVDTLRALRSFVDARELAVRIVVLSGHCEVPLVREVINHFATGFIQKATPSAIFQQAVALTLAGGVYIPEVVLHEMAGTGKAAVPGGTAPAVALTPRESEIAALLVRGFTYKRIARELERIDGRSISEHTVRAHVGNIAWKLGVTENAKAGVMAEIARRGLVFSPPARSP